MSTIFVALLSRVERLTQCIMPQKKAIRRYNTATGCWDVLEPDKQADQQVRHVALPRAVDTAGHEPHVHGHQRIICMHPDRSMPQSPPGGRAAASEDDLSDGDHLELGQSQALSGQPEDHTSAGDSDEQDENTDEQLPAAEVNRKLADLLAEDKVKETFLHRGSTLDRKVPS